MATVNYIKEKKQTVSAMKGVMSYCSQEQKVRDPNTNRRLISGINCNGEDAFTEFMATKQVHGQTQGFQFYQYTQSFHPGEKLTPAEAHEIALEFAEQAWPGHEVQVCTHCDAAHIHSHFVINSVSFETGKKLHQDPNTLRMLRGLSDGICMAHGLTTLTPYAQSGKKLSTREYRAAAKGESWKFKLMASINDAMQHSGSLEDFIYHMKRRGYQLTWTKERRYITFFCPNGMKCRDIKLHDPKFLKGNIEHELFIREQISGLIFSGRISPEELTKFGSYGAGALSAFGIRYPGEAVGGMAEPIDAGGTVPADSVHDDCSSDNQGADGEIFARHGETGEAVSGQPSDAERVHPYETGEVYLTGWEGQREIYFRDLRTGRKEQGRDPRTGFRYAPPVQKASAVDGPAVYSPVSDGLHGLAALAGVIENDSDDPEERRKKLEAQRAGSNLSAAIDLAAGVAMVLNKDREDVIHEEDPQTTLNMN
ncbi:MAG: relaxase/mobilization nuclease domain-containing protein [Faecousia sp.]